MRVPNLDKRIPSTIKSLMSLHLPGDRFVSLVFPEYSRDGPIMIGRASHTIPNAQMIAISSLVPSRCGILLSLFLPRDA